MRGVGLAYVGLSIASLFDNKATLKQPGVKDVHYTAGNH